ncbi:MAG: OsmC family protein [Acidimicrobiales bacterium]|nr:OsmC family protein [Acidimicrobiales bacterium]
MEAVHHYFTRLTWKGSTGLGYEHYDRGHSVVAPPAHADLAITSDPAFKGDSSRLNPEQLLLAAASSCQMLSFLAVASRARLDVVSYSDDATALMAADNGPMRITTIRLQPEVALVDTKPSRISDERLGHLIEVAHKECFIANTLNCEISIDPIFTWG